MSILFPYLPASEIFKDWSAIIIDRMRLSWLIPQEKKFFDIMENQSGNVLKGVETLIDMIENYSNVEERRRKIKEIEETGDSIVHDLHDLLHKTFITPIDREDIASIASCLDDVLDLAEGVSDRLVLYKIETPSIHVKELTRNILTAMQNIHSAIQKLRNSKDFDGIKKHIIEVNRLEGVADAIYRNAIAELLTTEDAIEIIKLKEIYDNLEFGVDRCEDAADIIENILRKHA